VDVRQLLLPSTETGSHSAAVAYNVLEHIPEDVAALRGFAKLLRPGGAVVLIVPAFEFAMGRFDRAVGHQRRYRVAGLRAALEEASLRVERIHYVNSLGLLAWFVGMRLLRMTPAEGPVLTVWDRGVIPVLRRLERGRQPPFGQSVFAVARA
jgi:SAM-dependent methyltransferase